MKPSDQKFSREAPLSANTNCSLSRYPGGGLGRGFPLIFAQASITQPNPLPNHPPKYQEREKYSPSQPGSVNRISLNPHHDQFVRRVMTENNNNHMAEQIETYLDEELSPAERLAFDAHIAGCEPCRALLEESRQTRAELRSRCLRARASIRLV